MDLKSELLAIREANGGRLTPALVVDAARSTTHPLHSRFEWDNAVAGEKYRIEQARDLIRSVRVTFIGPDETTRDVHFFQPVKHPVAGHVYEPSEEIVQDPLLTKIILRDMEREWRQLRSRYESFNEFWQLVTADLPTAANS